MKVTASMSRPIPVVALLVGSLVLSACGDDPMQAGLLTPDQVTLTVVSGTGQAGLAGEELPDALVVRVTRNGRGNAGVPRYLVNFRVVEGGGQVFAGAVLTDATGYARDYWTLGPVAGMNRLEVRSIDPSSGEKVVHGSFTAEGIVPEPETCNGVDDDLDGTVDEPDWIYCIGGSPAPNTDGQNSCEQGYQDANDDPTDGCEASTAQPEICNGIDDDFDGQTDEGLPYCIDGLPAPNTDGENCDAGWSDLDGAPTNGCEASSTTASCMDALEQDVVAFLNEARLDAGLPALAVDDRLVAAALRHSEDMASTGTLSHDGSDGSTHVERIQDAGYPRPFSEFVASVTGFGQHTAQTYVDLWLGSAVHRNILLDSDARHVGAAIVFDADGDGWATLTLGRSLDGPVTGTCDGS